MKPTAKLASVVAFAMGLTLTSGAANASHVSHLQQIDAIDHIFGSGGGSFSGSLSGGADDDWLVFGANAGDILNVNVNIGSWFVNAVLLQDIGNGNFEIGDGANVINFNSSQVGNGSPLQILAHIGPTECSSIVVCSLINFVAPYTGQYGIALNSANESLGFSWTVELSGNTANLAAIPVPAAMPLLAGALGSMGLIGWFRRRKTTGSA